MNIDYGYDYKSGLWIVGNTTIWGTINTDNGVLYFDNPEEAKEYCGLIQIKEG